MPEKTFLDHILSLPIVKFALLSPDQRRVAFMWQRIHENTDVFVVDCDGSTPPVALTHTPKQPSWKAGRPIRRR